MGGVIEDRGKRNSFLVVRELVWGIL